jgi:hypothetical protein
VLDDDLCKYFNLKYDAKENDDFKNAKIFKIYLSNTRDVVYIGSTCDELNKCMSNFRIKSKSPVNWSYDTFYMMIRRSYFNCKKELVENCPCNNAEESKNKQNEIYDKLAKK